MVMKPGLFAVLPMGPLGPFKDDSHIREDNERTANEVKALEYATLKIPYEVLNKRFRSTQKEIDKLNHRYATVYSAIDAKLPKNNDRIPASSISHYIPASIERLKEINENLRRSIEEEHAIAENMQRRLSYFVEAENAKIQPEVGAFRKERIDRMIIDHLYRTGMFETANMLAEASRIQDVSEDHVYKEMQRVEDALRQRNLKPCLDWIFDNRSKLRRIQSDFEMQVRMQECIEMIRDDRRLDAVKWVRKFFSPLDRDQWNKRTILQLMGLLGSGKNTTIKAYKKLYGQERWNTLIEKFRQESAKVFQLSKQSAFSTCLQTGIAALKTPCCKRSNDSKCKCSVCHPDVYDLAAGLPIRHSTQSRLICAHTGEKIDEDNIPMMLPNGFVYGQNAINELTNEKNEIVCPRTKDTFQKLDVLRLFVL
uniref:E3 ubiquitin-protein transferase MAEA n=1 Tax=Steinernema glaseri TaxID=37863 RepID=A0A1I7Z1L2_9BILA